MTCVIVAGVHRSGSSAVAGVLHRLGVNMGKHFIDIQPDNPLGYYEEKRLVNLNRRIVDWRRPDSYKFLPKDQWDYSEYVLLRKQKLWGVKDPRLCFTLKHFIAALERCDEDYRILRVSRPREHSIESLAAREGWSWERADSILWEHKRALERNLRPYDVATVEYDELIDHTERTIDELIEQLGLTNAGKQLAMKFICPELRHYA